MSAQEYEPIDTLEQLLELRILLKKYNQEGAAKSLQILRRIKKANIPKQFIKRIKVSKTIAKLAKMKFEDPSEDQANVLKYAQFLTNQWRSKLFNKSKIEFDPINYRGKKPNQNGNSEQPKEQPKAQSSSTANGKQTDLPDLKNETRNKALNGIKKYLKNDTGKSSEEMLQLCLQVEEQLFKRNCNEEGSDFKVEEGLKSYKSQVKSICCKMIDANSGGSFCKKITSSDNQGINNLVKSI